MFISLLIFSCVLPQQIFTTNSGLYVDNGIDQTVIQRVLSRKEKLQFEREMLNLLGLPRKPRRLSNLTTESSAPRFLLDIYRSLDKGKVQFTNSEFNVGGEDIRSVKESDSIMTFLSHNRHVSNVRHERGKRIWFDLSDIHPRDIVMNAELRLFQEKQNLEWSEYTIALYQVLLDYNGEKELEYVDAVNTTLNNEGWLVFNVSGPVNTWIAMPSSNRGLYISVHAVSKSYHEISPEDIGVMSLPVPDKEDKQPFLVAFIKSNNIEQKVNHRRTARDTRRKKSDVDVSYPPNPFTPESAYTLRSCQIQTLYVNFKDLNWHEWIIAPDGYAAFYCSGLCDFPLNAHMNATNHAIVQTLVHLIDPFEVPKPYCAPTKLGPIAVLYYLEDSNVILKKYKNMIVKSCGCH